MADGMEVPPPHVLEENARRDEMVLDLCERLGFEFVMESAARQWARRDPLNAFTVGLPASLAERRAAARSRSVRGRRAIEDAIEALADLSASRTTMRVRMQASESQDQLASFLKASAGRGFMRVKAKSEAEMSYDPVDRILTVDGIMLPLVSLFASHGRVYSNPHDEAKTEHTLSLRDTAAGAEMKLTLA